MTLLFRAFSTDFLFLILFSFTSLDGEFMEKLLLILKFSILVDSHCSIRGGRCNEFQGWVQSYTLNILFVSLKSLHLTEFIGGYSPQDGRAIKTCTHQIVRVIAPAKVHHVSNMAS